MRTASCSPTFAPPLHTHTRRLPSHLCTMKYIKGLLLPALLALAPTTATAKDQPLVEPTPFKNELVNLMYFDDSGVALVQELDTGKIWRSHDAGKGWKHIKDLQGLGIIKSPFDNKVALVLSEKKHWITYDQGETWDSFETELPPSPGGPVGWHALNNKKIMINEIENCFTAPCLGRVGLLQRVLPIASLTSGRHTTPRTASRQSPNC